MHRKLKAVPPVRHDQAFPEVRGNAARVIVLGPASPLRSAVTTRLRADTWPLACVDRPEDLPRVLPSPAPGSPDGPTVVFVTVPRLPGLAGRLRHRYRALAARSEQAAAAARDHGAARFIALSTVFRYADDGGLPPGPDAGMLTAAEVAEAAAAERAARLFARLGGDSVVLRLGWTWGREDGITRRILATARRGWRLIDGDPDAWISLIAQDDAARAVGFALTAPPGCYDVTDGFPVSQAMLNARLTVAAARELHPLDDSRWGARGALFGHSRRITSTRFSSVTGWRPLVTDTTASLIGVRQP